MFAYFEQVALDYEGSRDHYVAHNARELAEVEARLADAERAAMRAAAAIDKADEDWAAGTMDAENHGRLTAKFNGQRTAAEAEVGQLRKRRKEVAAATALRESDDFLRELTTLRAAIAGKVWEAHGVEAVRTALMRLFEGFTLHRADSPGARALLAIDLHFMDGEVAYVIEPHERPDAVLRRHGPLMPVDMTTFVRPSMAMRREPLPLVPDENKGALSQLDAVAVRVARARKFILDRRSTRLSSYRGKSPRPTAPTSGREERRTGG